MSDHLSIHAYWDALSATALVGTNRHPTLPDPPAGALAALVARLPKDDAAATLLAAAAATTLFCHAGMLPPAATTPPLPGCPADVRLPCSPQAQHHLDLILADQQPLLAEWLDALNAANLSAPPAAAPALLDLAANDDALRPAILRALGPRGLWLAQLNPEWAVVATTVAPDDAATAEARWQIGTRAERVALFSALRRSNPQQARGLVQLTWRSEKADERTAFLAALQHGLGMDDEPFLEEVLDDRSKEVRITAAKLLASLPASRLAARMTNRALALLKYHGGLFSKLTVVLPEACDAALQRDGVNLKAAQGMGERAWWLRAILSATPPAAWVHAWSLTPDAILRLRMPKEWRALLLDAWTTASLSYQDQQWAVALLQHWNEHIPANDLAPLFAMLPAAQRESLLIQLLKQERKPLGRDHRLLPTLRREGAWGHELARTVIAALARVFSSLREEHGMDWHLHAALNDFARNIPPALAAEAIAAIAPAHAEHAAWANATRNVAVLLRLRKAMHEAL
ncbi:MAG: hypothetical protein EI684_17625 [Candidatus Viridilinea halotolerans]|uniref:Uncharacterized protein n=1 Tax=Candidatus Viridilinea halotolerans TaxID=2491704 RepID=A0A426TU15_9CHLR|nr:MAG: hypothetical protein EI684_17625 [Candidatus Viridilinea halotolerans]